MALHSFLPSFVLALALLLGASLVQADNDWQTACIAGTCSYESGDGVTVPWSTLLLDGASGSLSDITPAAGWHILSQCEPNSSDPQTIQIVCVDQSLGCSHLFTDGAEDTVIRLPENCGSGPFARLTSLIESPDQSLPADSTITPQGPLRTLSFDYDFSSITRQGGVSFTLAATSNPRQRTLLSTPILRRALGKPIAGRRGLSTAQAQDLVSQFVELSRAPTAAAKEKVSIASEGDISLASIGDFTKDWSTDFHPLSLHQQFPLFDLTLTCPANSIPGVPSAIDAHVSADAQVDVDLSVSVGFIVSGSIIPLEITQLALTSGLTADAKAVVNLKADVTGQLDQTIPLYTADIPGLNIPGIITLGPSFTINAHIIGTLSTLADITVTTSWKAPKVELVFPPDQGNSGVDQQRGDSSIDLSVGAQGTIKGTIEAHLIPKLEVGLSILSGIAKAGVFLELDPYATLDFDLTGSASAAVSTTAPAPTGAVAARQIAAPAVVVPRVHPRDLHRRAPSALEVRDVESAELNVRDGQASGNITGCIGLDLGFKIRAGAQGSLKPFFDESVSWDLVDVKGDIFDKCFAAATPKRALDAPLRRRTIEPPSTLGKRATEITCPTIPLELLHVIQQNIAAA